MLKTNPSQSPAVPQSRDPFSTLWTRLFGDALQDFYGGAEQSLAPRTNISENDHAYELAFELPGLEEKDIEVHMHDHALTVSASRKEEKTAKDQRWHRVEHRYGQFTRSIVLPQDASEDGIAAVYRQGVLTVTVPKAPESRPTRIEVRGN